MVHAVPGSLMNRPRTQSVPQSLPLRCHLATPRWNPPCREPGSAGSAGHAATRSSRATCFVVRAAQKSLMKPLGPLHRSFIRNQKYRGLLPVQRVEVPLPGTNRSVVFVVPPRVLTIRTGLSRRHPNRRISRRHPRPARRITPLDSPARVSAVPVATRSSREQSSAGTAVRRFLTKPPLPGNTRMVFPSHQNHVPCHSHIPRHLPLSCRLNGPAGRAVHR